MTYRARTNLAIYGVSILATLIILVLTMQLWRADFQIPFQYDHDALLTCMLIKSMSENGWYLNNPLLGAPMGQHFYDFPIGDTLTFVVIKALTMLLHNYAVIINVLFLLSFPLVTVTSVFALRRLGISAPCAIFGALIYCFSPYHFLRGERHLFLSFYYAIPLITLVFVWLRSDETFTIAWPQKPSGKMLSSLAICLLVSVTGFYYALFSCFFLAMAGIGASIKQQSRTPLVTTAILIAVLGIGMTANVVPNLAYWQTHGRNPEAVRRQPSDTETFGLKIAQLVLPVTGHRLPELAHIKQFYNESMLTELINENDDSTLGIVTNVGFFLLLTYFLFPRKSEVDGTTDSLASFNLAAILLGTIGGFGSVIAIFLPSVIRSYDRISIFIAFFAVIAVTRFLDRHYNMAANRISFCAILGLLLTIGLLDQTSRNFIPNYDGVRAQFTQDAAFVHQIETLTPPNAMIFQLPAVVFPESPTLNHMTDYQLLRGYLHSDTLRWSYGGVKGRQTDDWTQHPFHMPVPEFVQQLETSGYRGLYINRDCYPKGSFGPTFEAQLQTQLHTKPLVSDDGHLVFFVVGK